MGEGRTFSVDVDRRCIVNGDRRLRLGPDCWRLFGLLYGNIGRLVSYHSILDSMYGHRSDGGPDGPQQCIRVHVSRIRKALRGTGWGIEGIWGEGYRLDVEGPRVEREREWSQRR